ncbi:MAG: chorismate-binding protein, partial [Bdellovibrionales bacterium]|nr:chorismate-binding protein [Bdellovibrionales bacterium]
MIPFSQIRERGYQARCDGEKILCLKVSEQERLEFEELLRQLPDTKISLSDGPSFNLSRKEYGDLVSRIIAEAIGRGEGANFVLPRACRGKIDQFSPVVALSLFKAFASNDYGSYWKFIFYSGEKYFVGATPERHLQVRGRKVRMNPISGTFRKTQEDQSVVDFRDNLVQFLHDKKEIFELFMVVDEELKMMAKICDQGGMVVGPLVKEMSKLLHTEYLLSGVSDHDIIDMLRDSMFAATVTGSPLENACRIIYEYDKESRGYYGGALALIGRDAEGNDTLDSPIAIRMFELDSDGSFVLRVGATLVKDSDPEGEARETEAKASAALAALSETAREQSASYLSILENDDEVLEALQQRNQFLSKFWFFLQEPEEDELPKEFQSLSLTIVDNEDEFSLMMRHMFARMGISVKIVSNKFFNLSDDKSDIIIIGPGPGDPNDDHDHRVARARELTEELLRTKRKFLSVCLGHQILCRVLNFKVARKNSPFQGQQEKIDLFGKQE